VCRKEEEEAWSDLLESRDDYWIFRCRTTNRTMQTTIIIMITTIITIIIIIIIVAVTLVAVGSNHRCSEIKNDYCIAEVLEHSRTLKILVTSLNLHQAANSPNTRNHIDASIHIYSLLAPISHLLRLSVSNLCGYSCSLQSDLSLFSCSQLPENSSTFCRGYLYPVEGPYEVGMAHANEDQFTREGSVNTTESVKASFR
jgi:hypothetical protein